MSLDIDPKQVEQQRCEDRYRDIAAIIDRGQKPPADAKAAVLELFQELRRHFVDWPRKLASEIRSASNLEVTAKANLSPEIELGIGYVKWKDSREDACCLRGYMLRRWPDLWGPIDGVWRAFNAAVYSGDGGLHTFLKSRPNKEQLEYLSGKALILNEWLRHYEAVIQRYGLETTDSSEEPAPSLDDEDLSILRALERRAPLRLTQDQIEIATSPRISRRTIAKRMPRLVSAGLAALPHGNKQGYTITQQGRDLLKKLGKS
jgi:predicted transcriptional regulator